MLKRNPAALVTIGINIVSAALCVPTQFPIISTFYRATMLYVINIFVTEIPKWGSKRNSKTFIDALQDVLFLLGFVLIAIGAVNLTKPYSSDSLPQEISIWIWIYFGLSLLMLLLSIISSLELSSSDDRGKGTPSVVELDTTTKK